MSVRGLKNQKLRSIVASCSMALGLAAVAMPAAHAGDSLFGSGRLLATGGATQIEGSAGGGIVPWALISGYGTEDQIGGTAFVTRVGVPNYDLNAYGVSVGFYDRVELSVARQDLALDNTVLSGVTGGNNTPTHLKQDIIGLKVIVAGDAIFAQDSLMPQISVGIQYKKNKNFDFVPTFLGAKHNSGVDVYVAATKVFLGGLAGRNVLLNATVRGTKANQMGLLGFGSQTDDQYHAVFEGSVGVFLDPANTVLVGAEYRQKHDNKLLNGAIKEDAYKDVYLAYIPNKRFALVAAYADLGNLPDTAVASLNSKKRGMYLSAQLSF